MDKPPDNWDDRQTRRKASFLQSALWGEFQSSMGVKPYYFEDDGFSCLLLRKRGRLGTYLFSQYGPTVDSTRSLGLALQVLTGFGRELGAGWLSLEPMSDRLDSDQISRYLNLAGAKPAARHREPDLTRIVDLSASEDDLLSTISQSTRSFIRKNQREKFISFVSSTNPADISIFIEMLDAVSRRQNVYFYPDGYFKKQAQMLMPAGMMHLEIAMMGNQPVASALFHDYGEVTTYTYAGSLPEARKTSASALLLWQAMLNAKKRGQRQMDLYGIAPDGAPASHPWAGFTSFKAKFGGQTIQYAGSWDIPLNNRYRLYRAAHRARKTLKRH